MCGSRRPAAPIEVGTDLLCDPGLSTIDVAVNCRLVADHPRLHHGSIQVQGTLGLGVPQKNDGQHLGFIVERQPGRWWAGRGYSAMPAAAV